MKLKIVLTVIALSILTVVLVFVNKEKEEVYVEPIKVYVELVQDTRKELELLEIDNETFLEALDKKYELVIENGMVKKIGFLEAYNTAEYFIQININDEFSNKGINSITLKQHDKISFIYTKVN